MSRPASPAARPRCAQAAMELRLTARRGENVLVTLVIPVGGPALLRARSTSCRCRRGRPGRLPAARARSRSRSSPPASSTSGSRPPTSAAYGVLKRLGGSPLGRDRAWSPRRSPRSSSSRSSRSSLLVARRRGRASAGAPGPGASPACCSWPRSLARHRSPSPVSGCCSPARCAPRRRWPSPTACSSRCLLLGGIVLPIDHLPDAARDGRRLLPAAALVRGVPGRARRAAATSGDRSSVVGRGRVGALVVALRWFRWE